MQDSTSFLCPWMFTDCVQIAVMIYLSWITHWEKNNPERRILKVIIKRLELWENTTKLLGVKGMTANVIQVVASAATTAASTVTEATTEGKLDKIFQSSEKASELSYSIMNIIYILAAMIIVVAIFTVVLYIYKFIMNRRDPNYKKNDDTFLDD